MMQCTGADEISEPYETNTIVSRAQHARDGSQATRRLADRGGSNGRSLVCDVTVSRTPLALPRLRLWEILNAASDVRALGKPSLRFLGNSRNNLLVRVRMHVYLCVLKYDQLRLILNSRPIGSNSNVQSSFFFWEEKKRGDWIRCNYCLSTCLAREFLNRRFKNFFDKQRDTWKDIFLVGKEIVFVALSMWRIYTS